MEKRYLLPRMKEENIGDSDLGWKETEEAYAYLLRNLILEYESTESVFDGGTNAIPQVFEQMLVFEEAFFNKNSKEHCRALIEWEAVLVLMALKRIKNIDLDVIEVDLTGNYNNPFLKAVAEFCPRTKLRYQNVTWDFTYVLLLNEEPIAFFTPDTIVCPAKNLKKKLKALDWIAIGKENGAEALSMEFGRQKNEYSAIYHWLSAVKEEVDSGQKEPGGNDAVVEELERLADKYSSHVSGRYGVDLRRDVYPNMTRAIREEYKFLNFCSDFHLENKELEFLADKFERDIFCDRILLILYADRGDAYTKQEYGKGLSELVGDIAQLNNRKLIAVTEAGGGERPFYACLPFRTEFVDELIRHGITPEMFLEEFQIRYIRRTKSIEVVMSMKEIPHSFCKKYSKDQCEEIYGKELPGIYVWPAIPVENRYWKSYYTFVSGLAGDEGKRKVSVRVANLDAERNQYSDSRKNEAFDLFVSGTYPRYMEISKGSVSGYLPIGAAEKSLDNKGETVSVYFDIGHATTCAAVVWENRWKNLCFSKSRWIMGDVEKDSCVKVNFITPAKTVAGLSEDDERNYFVNLMNNFYGHTILPVKHAKVPFVNSQILLHDTLWDGNPADVSLSFIHAEYDLMDPKHRKEVHLFLEHILTYALRTGVLEGGEYFKVHFLHDLYNQDVKLGELKGLWEDVFKNVSARIGVSKYINFNSKYVDCCHEAESLAYAVYLYLKKRQKNTTCDPAAGKRDIYVGADIGWKKTVIVKLENLIAKHAEIDFGGKDISFLDDQIPFKKYQDMLGILLSRPLGGVSAGSMPHVLQEFGDLYKGRAKGLDYYYGLFDLIAMQIEKEDFRISPDIYNRSLEFRCFIQMLTYNLLLEFFSIGLAIGQSLDTPAEGKKSAHVILSGNGAKFICWVMNFKTEGNTWNRVIDETNVNELFILSLQESVLDMIKNGVSLVKPDIEIEHVVVELAPNPKNWLLEGYIFKENPGAFKVNNQTGEIQMEEISDEVDNIGRTQILELLESVEQDVFGSRCTGSGGAPAASGAPYTSLSDIQGTLKDRSSEICRKMAERIDKIKETE